MIPKIIHYCWFGKGEMPALYTKCIKSWEKVLPEYIIMRWDENSFDINCNQYVKEAYENKKYAFVTDFVRLYALYNFGGIYLDTDVEVIKPLDRFLSNEAFSGFEKKDGVPTGIMASEKDNQVIKDLLSDYDNMRFVLEDGSLNLTTNVKTISDYFIKNGIKMNGKYQVVNGFHMYPQRYFCTNSILLIFNLKPRLNVYTIHHYGGGWGRDGKKNQTLKFRTKRFIVGVMRNLMGTQRAIDLWKSIKNG
jgi:hypothetical protein